MDIDCCSDSHCYRNALAKQQNSQQEPDNPPDPVVSEKAPAPAAQNTESSRSSSSSPPAPVPSPEASSPALKEGSNYEPDTMDYLEAWAAAQLRAKEQMLAPSSAKFHGIATRNVIYVGCEKSGGVWVYKFKVTAKVDCKNAYGVMIRYTMRCDVHRKVDLNGKESWFVSEVTFIQ
jgi:hypothetical protein